MENNWNRAWSLGKKHLKQISVRQMKTKKYRKTDWYRKKRLRRRAVMEFQYHEARKNRNETGYMGNDDIHNYAQIVN